MARRIIDLTLPIHEGMQTFPVHWHPFVEITQLGRLGIEDRETRKVTLGTHTGTHMDAPRHFVRGGKSIDEIELDQLVGAATVIDFSQVPERTELGVADMERALAGRRPERLVLRYDWSDKVGINAYYTDHPYLSEAAAQWLIDNGVRLLAMDTPMPDDPRNGRGTCKDSPNHKIILGSGAVIVEYLTNLRQLSRPEVFLVVAPLKIREGDGSPVRCFAIED
jgi:arylformamidase